MQGVSILTDPAGNPTVLTVDLRHYEERLRPAVEALIRLVQELERRDERECEASLSRPDLDEAREPFSDDNLTV